MWTSHRRVGVDLSREGGCGPLIGGWVWTSQGRVGVDLLREGGCRPLKREWVWISQGMMGVSFQQRVCVHFQVHNSM